MTNEIKFKSPCPVYECWKEKRTDIINWVCSNKIKGIECKEIFKLTNNGKLVCKKCGVEGDLLAIKWSCNYHEGKKLGNFQALVNCVTIAATLELGEEKSSDFLEDIFGSLLEQRKKHK